MKKVSKLMALLLSLLMILSLFAACGDDKKSDETITTESEANLAGEDLLIGKWNVITTYGEEQSYALSITFNKDGTISSSFTQNDYDYFIEQLVKNRMSKVTDNDITEAGFATKEEAEEHLRELFKETNSYENVASYWDLSGEWSFEDNILLIEFDGGGEVYNETTLDAGTTTFTLYNDGNEEEGVMIFTKAK